MAEPQSARLRAEVRDALEVRTNYRKSLDQLLSLLQILDCDVDFIVRAKSA